MKKIKYICDGCGAGKETQLGHYNENKKRHNGKVYCISCSNKISATERHKKFNKNPKLKKAWKESIEKASHKRISFVNCEKCGRKISLNQKGQHLNYCDGNPIPKKERHEKLNGKTAWNKGLTCETDDRVLRGTIKAKAAWRKAYEDGNFIPYRAKNNSFFRGKCGWHKTWNDKNVFYRSLLEKNYYIVLDKQKIDYDVESLRIKYFHPKLNRVRFAIPDIYIPSTNTIIEIKHRNTLDTDIMKIKKAAYINEGYNFKLVLEGKEIPF
jgi:hypothetical protein